MPNQNQSNFIRNCAWLAGSALGGALLAGCGQVVTTGMVDLAPPPMSYAMDRRAPVIGGIVVVVVDAPGKNREERAVQR